jgi:hypothetical protein
VGKAEVFEHDKMSPIPIMPCPESFTQCKDSSRSRIKWKGRSLLRNLKQKDTNILKSCSSNEKFWLFVDTQLQTRVVSHCGLAIYIKKYVKAKEEELWKLKYFTIQK